MKPSDYGPFPFIPIKHRPKLEWPNGARIALWAIINVEIFSLDGGLPQSRTGKAPAVPNVLWWGERDYGNRVGIWRIMEVLERFGVRGTAAMNSRICDKHSQIVKEARKLGWEFIGHNETNAVRLNEIPPDQEHGIIRDVLDRIKQATGTRPVGWLGAGRQETWNTLDYLVEENCIYVADWPNDDQPYLMEAGGGKLVCVPYSSEINDYQAFHERKYSPGEFVAMVRRQFDVLYREGAESGRVFPISLHPYLIGVPHRIDCLTEALEYVCSHDGVWLATGAEIARHFLKVSRSQ